MSEPIEPGAGIHPDHPFAASDAERSPLRRFRGRLVAPVTLWTAIGGDGRRHGLTIASTEVVDGDPGRLLGLVDADADIWDAIQSTGRFVVLLLGQPQQRLADQFAGAFPAPGGPFRSGEWRDTRWGPVLVGPVTWVGCGLDSAREFGWRRLVEATIEHVELGDDAAPLLYHRGRYRTITGD